MADNLRFGYTLSSEEHPAQDLIDNAAKAEEAGFDFVGLSDHFAPWTEKQGNSPFSWTVLGGVSQRTSKIRVFLEVVCPIMRYHPAIVAQAAATTASLLEGRFDLGVGTGEYLNEHIVGEGWPHLDVRRDMLAEAITIIRMLFEGEYINYYGDYFRVEKAKIYSMPKTLPRIIVSGFGPKAVKLAGEMGDGLVSTAPNKESIELFEKHAGKGKPKYAQIHVCFDKDKNKARKKAFEFWPNSGIGGQLNSELRLPAYFEQAVSTLDEKTATEGMILGSDTSEYVSMVQKYKDAGFDHIYFHNIGPDQKRFLDFWKDQLASEVRKKFAT